VEHLGQNFECADSVNHEDEDNVDIYMNMTVECVLDAVILDSYVTFVIRSKII
jgi:hypothetical protein